MILSNWWNMECKGRGHQGNMAKSAPTFLSHIDRTLKMEGVVIKKT